MPNRVRDEIDVLPLERLHKSCAECSGCEARAGCRLTEGDIECFLNSYRKEWDQRRSGVSEKG